MTIKIRNVEIPGRAFLSPLAAYTSWPFRRICRRFGAALVTTEVAKAREIVRGIPATQPLIEFQPNEHPITGQMMSAEPEEAARATEILNQRGFDIVELNCGCPKRRVLSDNMGGALTGDPARAEQIIRAMVKASSVPVTVKMRIGVIRGQLTALDFARACESGGASALTVHPRFASGASSLPPDWEMIARVRETVKIPVFGNGGIHTPQDALRMMQQTGCAAVVIGQAAVGKPWIFQQVNALLATGELPPSPPKNQILDVLLEHYEGLVAHHGERRGTIMMRKQSCHYAKHLLNGKQFNMAATKCSTRLEFMAAVEQWLLPNKEDTPQR